VSHLADAKLIERDLLASPQLAPPAINEQDDIVVRDHEFVPWNRHSVSQVVALNAEELVGLDVNDVSAASSDHQRCLSVRERAHATSSADAACVEVPSPVFRIRRTEPDPHPLAAQPSESFLAHGSGRRRSGQHHRKRRGL
jgi:hypothetical protein